MDNGNSGLSAGKILTMNGFNYPNKMFKVLTGLGLGGAFHYLPFRCNSVNFDEMDVYAWT